MSEEYRWKNAGGMFGVHEGSGIVFAIYEDHSRSVAGSGVGREILRLRDALAAERERCAGVCEEMAQAATAESERLLRVVLSNGYAPLWGDMAIVARTWKEAAEMIRQG
jgi:hypothetical protein